MKIKMLDKTLKIFSNKKFFKEDIYVQIPDGYLKPEGTKDITENGEYNITEFENVNVNINTAKPEQTKSTTPTKNTQTILPDEGYVLDKVVVNPIPEQYIIPDGTLNITTTDEYNVTDYSKAKIVEPNLKPENISDGVTILGITGTLIDVKNTEQWTLTLNDGTEITKDVYVK